MSSFDAGILDTRIPAAVTLGGRAGAAMPTAAERERERELTRRARAEADYSETRASTARREAERQALLEAAFSRHSGDWEATEQEIAPLDPELALKVRKGRSEAQASMHQEFQERMQAERLGADLASSFVRMARQAPDLYPTLRQAIADRLPEDVRAALPEAFDDAALGAIEEAAVPAKDAMARAEANHKLILSGDWRKGLFGQLADADDAEEYANIIESYKPYLPKGALAMIPAWTPDAPDKAARIAMGPDAVIDNARADDRDAVLKRQGDARVAIAARSAAEEPLVAIVGADGQPVLVPRSKGIGKRPAGGGGGAGGGRGVTSGDANRMADFDTSLDDLDALNAALTETAGATGTSAAIGAGLPNVVTEYTGIGSKAKQRQGVIDRVKQVIGKTLEGGVLRKEDEYKYTKILPTISDPPEVAASKLRGLDAAIRQRRQTQIDALEDAGYDVSAYQARTTQRGTAPRGAPAGPAQTKAIQQPIPGIPGGVAESVDGGRTWKRVK